MQNTARSHFAFSLLASACVPALIAATPAHAQTAAQDTTTAQTPPKDPQAPQQQTSHEVKESGRAYKVGKFPFSANGRARTMGETSGFVKFIADAKTDELLGGHLIGPNVSELCAEVVLAFEYRGSSEDLGITVHSHPTLSEAVKEAALGVLGRSIHL